MRNRAGGLPGHKSAYSQQLLNSLGLYHYSGDHEHMVRIDTKNTLKAWWHDVIQRPGSPLEKPPLRWYFLVSGDVGSSAWTIASSGSGTPLALIDKRGGWAQSINGSGDNNYYSYFSLSEVAAPVDGSKIWFNTEIELGDVDQMDYFMGLCAKLGSGNLWDNRVDNIGFKLTDGSAVLTATVANGGVEETESTGVTLTDETEYKLAFVVTGASRVDFYVNSNWVCAITTGLPEDEEMALAHGVRNGQGVANEHSLGTTQVLLD